MFSTMSYNEVGGAMGQTDLYALKQGVHHGSAEDM